MLDAVLLDWENVLADTFTARCDALARALAEEGVAGTTLPRAPHEWSGLHAAARGALLSVGTSDDTLTGLVVARATRAFAERLGKGFVLCEGASEFVERLQGATALAIVTTATRSETEFMLRLAGFDGVASTVISADDAPDAVPCAAWYRQAMERLARRRPVQAERCVCLAGAVPMLRAARDAGTRTLAVHMPAHAAVEADGAVASLTGVSMIDIARMSGLAPAERGS